MGRPKKKQAEGLGDTVENILETTGIAKVAKWVMGEDCGCEERKQKLNDLWRYTKPECLTEDEYIYLDEFFKKRICKIIMNDLFFFSSQVFKDFLKIGLKLF